MSIESEVFGVELSKNDIFSKISFEKALSNINDKVILVEGTIDKKIYGSLFERENVENIFLITVNGKPNALEYMKLDDTVFAILDRDFDILVENTKVFYTKQANLEAELMNYKTIEELLMNEENLHIYSDHIKMLENVKTKISSGDFKSKKLRSDGNYKKKWLKYISEIEFITNNLVEIHSVPKTNVGSGIHCAKEIIHILGLLNTQNSGYEVILLLKAMSVKVNSYLIQNIIKNKIFL